MIRKILNLGGRRVPACNENEPNRHADNVRALATEAALATSVDASPAVVINLWAHGQRTLGEHSRRRRAS